MSPLVLVGMLLVAASSAVLGDVSHILGSSGGTPSQAAEINYNLASPQPRDFWWMDPNSPLKAAYDYYKKCAAKGNCLPPTALGGEGQAPQNQAVAHPQPFRPQPNPFAPQQQQQIDINKNPFFNGQFQGITDKIPHQQQQGGQGAGSHQQQQRPLHIDISKNPFFNGVVTTGSGAPIPKGEGFLGVQPAQPFNNNGNKKPFATTHPLESKKPFATTHPLNGPVVECRGSGKICVDKEVCVNGVVNKNGEGLLQVRTDVQYCDSNREVCCKLHAGETPKSPVLSGFNDLTGITAGKSSVPGLIKFQGAAGLSPGSIQVILDDPQLKPSIYSVGESGSQHSSSSTPKTIRDVSPGSNSVFSSTVDYSDTKFDDIVGASAFQGPAYLPPKGTPTPPRYNTPEPDLPSVSTYQPSIPTRAPSSPRPFNTTPRPTPPPYTIPVIVSSPSAGTTFVSRQPSFPSTYLPPASSPRPFPTTQRVSSTYLPPTRPPPTRPPPTRPPPPPTTVREYLPPSSTPYYNNQPTYTPRVPQPGGQSTVYIPPATQPSRPPTGGYTYPKPTPTFGYPTPSTPPIGGESNNVNNNYLPPPKKPYTEPPYSPSEPPPYSSLPPSRPTQPPYSRPTQPPYSRPTQPPYSRPPTQTYLPPTRPPTDNIPEPDTPTDVRLLPKSCAAALKCVQEIYCTADGLISGVPVVLTKEQEINRVPTTTCLEVQSGTIGKCCRDPNYVDPWPSANLVNGEDDGQYKEDDSFGKYTPDLNRIVRSDTESQRPPQTEQFQNPPPQQPECGARHSGTNPPGVGPLDVNFAEIPWQAMILRDSNRSLLCGGAIIKRNAVLTTAHCVQGLETSDVLVKGGEWKLGIDEEPLPFQIVKVSAIVRHPEYKHGSLVNDLAILFLEEKLRPAKNIGTICLPPPNQIPTQNCIATGWGKRILQLHAKGAIMHAIDINVMETNQCRETLADQFQHALDNYSPNTLCGYSNKDQCRVDHGSALACSPGGNGQYTLSGIFAWDTGCKHKGQIGGYIAPDVEWIENSLSKPFNELKQLERNYVSTQQ